MAQPIKHNAGTKSSGCCLRKNNFDIGVVNNIEYGPTSSTDFWNGFDVPTGGFVTFQNKTSQGPSIYNIPSVNELVSYGKNLNIGPVINGPYVIRVCSALNDVILINTEYPELPLIDSNIFTIDAGYTPSYGWGGTDWFDITGNAIATQGTLQGFTSFVTGSSGNNYTDSYMNFDANTQNSWVEVPYFGSVLSQFTINVWVRPQTTANYDNKVNIVGQISAEPNYTLKSNCNFLIRGNGTNSFEGVMRIGGTEYVVSDSLSLTPNTWYNFTFTYDGSEIKLYRDKVPVTSAAVLAPAASNNGVTLIGGTISAQNNQGPPNYFNGNIGLVNIYNDVLSLGDIETLYDTYHPRF